VHQDPHYTSVFVFSQWDHYFLSYCRFRGDHVVGVCLVFFRRFFLYFVFLVLGLYSLCFAVTYSLAKRPFCFSPATWGPPTRPLTNVLIRSFCFLSPLFFLRYSASPVASVCDSCLWCDLGRDFPPLCSGGLLFVAPIVAKPYTPYTPTRAPGIPCRNFNFFSCNREPLFRSLPYDCSLRFSVSHRGLSFRWCGGVLW
jgi:hypothetical protein